MLANPHLGEFALEVGGRTWVLTFSIDALCALEQRMGMSVNKIGDELQADPRLSLLRSMLCAGLRTRHPQMTETEAGIVLQKALAEIGGPAFGEVLAQAFFHVFNAGGGDGAASEDPQTAGRTDGTGASSSGSGATSPTSRPRTSGARRRRSSSAPSAQA